MTTRLKLRKPTPRALKVYKKHGLLSEGTDKKAEVRSRLALYTDQEALKEVLEVTFADELSDAEIEDLDLQAFGGAIEDFFVSLFARSGKSETPNKRS